MEEILKIYAPVFPESISEGTISEIYKKPGEYIQEGEIIAEIETDKIVLEVPIIKNGIIKKIFKQQGDTIKSKEILIHLLIKDKEENLEIPSNKEENLEIPSNKEENLEIPSNKEENLENYSKFSRSTIPPSKRKLFKDPNIETINYSFNNKKIDKNNRTETRVKISRLRQTIAARLLSSQNNCAIVTTFNEVDMSAVINIRAKFKETFNKKHNIKLGFMSFYIKASLIALQNFPTVNAFLDNQEIIYHNYVDIGIAVGSVNGLVVPIIRNVDKKSFAEIEKDIIDKANKAKTGKLSVSDMQGGTFTITNGGVYGSMLSTPIINPPQCAILGMHNIVKRPVVDINNNIIIKPIMYLALSYDHRLIDGSTSVKFLNTIKNNIEDPNRMLISI